ncbi:MAG: hypothetical protein Q3962_00970 [Corynebacterium sp.]|nr:hypothetical protein [Corynebacterium sp.]
MSTATRAKVDISSMTPVDLALHMHAEFRSVANSTYVNEAGQHYGCSRPEANMLMLAGFGYAHKKLGRFLHEHGVRPPTAAEFVRLARTLLGEWESPETGKVKQAQLARLCALVERVDFSNMVSGLFHLSKLVGKVNAEFKEAQEAAKRAAYEAAKAANPEPEPVPVADFSAIVDALPDKEPGAPAVDYSTTPEPKAYWTKEDLRFRVVKERPGFNTFIFEGISDEDTAVFMHTVQRLHSQLPPEIQKQDKAVRDGHAAFMILVESTRLAAPASKIRLNVVVNLPLLESHPEFAIYFENKYLTARELMLLVEKWNGSDEEGNLLVTDLNGRVISFSTVRLTPEVFRIISAVQLHRCVAPHCKKLHGHQSHHLVEYAKQPRTNLTDVVPICEPHHLLLTNGRAKMTFVEDLCTSVWVENGRVIIDLAGDPSGTRLQALGAQHGLDPLVPADLAKLRRILIDLTEQRLHDAEVELDNPEAATD